MTTETLMTQEPAPGDVAPPTGQGNPTAEAGADISAQGDAAPAQGDAAQGGTAQSAASAQSAPQGAPEKYEFKAAEGVKFDGEVIGAFSEVAKELNLPQDQAQKVLDKMAPVIQARQSVQIQAARNEWAELTRADKELGGEKLEENLSMAKKGLEAVGSSELRTLLNESGLGNHPEVIRAFHRMGKMISEDSFVSGQAGKANQADPRRLYSASNMNP